MKKALVSLNPNLGSSIALRYVNHMANRIHPTLHGLHVVEPKQVGTEPGSGWVQKTWENALAETGREDLRRFLEMEQVASPLLRHPQIRIGDRSEQLLEELADDQYVLFLEGVPPTSHPLDFYTLLKSRLYRSLPCPALVVKNLAPSDRVALLTNEKTESEGFLSCLLEVLNPSGLEVDIIDILTLDKDEAGISEENPAAAPDNGLKMGLNQAGVTVTSLKRVAGKPLHIADMFKEYGLVAAALGHSPRKNDPFVELLGRIATPVLVCWQ